MIELKILSDTRRISHAGKSCEFFRHASLRIDINAPVLLFFNVTMWLSQIVSRPVVRWNAGENLGTVVPCNCTLQCSFAFYPLILIVTQCKLAQLQEQNYCYKKNLSIWDGRSLTVQVAILSVHTSERTLFVGPLSQNILVFNTYLSGIWCCASCCDNDLRLQDTHAGRGVSRTAIKPKYTWASQRSFLGLLSRHIRAECFAAKIPSKAISITLFSR